jgi:hypothetical protein
MPLTLEQSIGQPFLVPLRILCSKFVSCTHAEQRIESGELFNQNCAGF